LPGSATTKTTKLGVPAAHGGPAWSPHRNSPASQNTTGTSGNGVDAINGGLGNDVIDALVGDDVVDGGAGDDTIYGRYGSRPVLESSGRRQWIAYVSIAANISTAPPAVEGRLPAQTNGR